MTSPYRKAALRPPEPPAPKPPPKWLEPAKEIGTQYVYGLVGIGKLVGLIATFCGWIFAMGWALEGGHWVVAFVLASPAVWLIGKTRKDLSDRGW